VRAKLKQVSGSRRHLDVLVGRYGASAMPDPVSLRVVRDGAGFSLLRLDAHGVTITHTWHASIEAAKERAAADYGVADDDWAE
jgi:hypothetical protein